MLKFDKDVLNALKKLEKAGYETYATGDCVIQWGNGESPLDWDLVTKATGEQLQEVFPEGEVIDKATGVLRLDFTSEETDEECEKELVGSVCDVTPIPGTIEDFLATQGFTIMAVADDPARNLVDPYKGMDDIKKKLVRTVGSADEVFSQKPVLMMQAIRYVSELGYDLHKEIYDGIVRNWRKLLDAPVGPIRRELELILTGANTGKALNMMADTGLMAAVFGEEVSRKMSSQEMHQFMMLTEGIDKTKPVLLRRLGLFYTVLNEKRGIAAIERMNFDSSTEDFLRAALREMIKITFLSNEVELKRYIFEHGMERYNDLHNLAKAQRIVYDQPATKIEARNHYMREIRKTDAPIFVEDLVIDGNDIMEAGITDDPEKAEELLRLVIAKVHQNPVNNNRKVLLKLAKKYSRNKLSVASRYVRWIR